ncbi:hypothetical protein [Nocardia abscessus]|uniref:hypothetical protein n=1 Tax=Nocardia abscessus TaxID=120957 RepID=UPI00030D1B4E|nr:hypothetical protein [Nocardia abscessus]MCC3333566.1 hypothetical protein [Nocardia abscessus]
MTDAADPGPYRVNLYGESTGPEGQYLVWHSGSRLEVETAESLQEALEDAQRHESSEYSIFEHIEGPAGDVPARDVQRWLDKLSREESNRWLARRESDRGRVRYRVVVRSLDGEHEGVYETTFSEVAALSYARELNLPGRVRVYSTIVGDFKSFSKDDQTTVLDYGDDIPPAEEGTHP